MARLIEKLSIESGYCCTYDMLRANRVHSSEKLAEILEVSTRQIQYWRTKVARKELEKCEDCPPPGQQRKPLRSPYAAARSPPEEPDPGKV